MTRLRRLVPLAAALSLAAGSGFLVSQALSAGPTPPSRTVTVDVGTGQQGPPGPPGPKGDPGPAGDFTCLQGYTPGILVINSPGGHVQAYLCLQD
jgi:hypothetical protein